MLRRQTPRGEDPRDFALSRLLEVLTAAGLKGDLSWIEVGHVLDVVKWDSEKGRSLGYRTPFEVAE